MKMTKILFRKKLLNMAHDYQICLKSFFIQKEKRKHKVTMAHECQM